MSICRILIALLALLCSRSLSAASKPVWPPVTPEELAETKSKIEPEAPAEALIFNIEVDDRGFPQERQTTVYFRFKIYQPEKAEEITRMSDTDILDEGKMTIRARLTLPSGTVKEFGRESIKERTLAKKGRDGGFFGWLTSSDFEVKEKFLAITGVEPGAVLEYRITGTTRDPSRIGIFALQQSFPVRQATYFCYTCPDTDEWSSRTFALNPQGGKMTEDNKKHTVAFTATNLRSILDEPFTGPATDNALTIVSSYDNYERILVGRSGRIDAPGEVDPKLGPWAVHSTIMNWWARDYGYPTAKVKKLAAEITKDLADPEARARAIHNHVLALSQRQRFRPGPRPKERVKAESLDDVIEVEKRPEVLRPSAEFLCLALALYRSAGLEAELVLLPDRQAFRFNPQFVSPAFLEDYAAAVKIGDRWRFSVPQNETRLPFGLLPWQNEAQLGLLALDHKQEFIKVPATPAEQSLILTTGKFSLDAEGTLTGECSRSFSGQTAVELRGSLRKDDKEQREKIAVGKFGFDPKVVEVKIKKIDGIREADQPISIVATITWPGFATRTKDRLLLRPSVFRIDAPPPFTSSERRHPVHFPYRWQESDRLEIAMPEGFAPESPSSPTPNLTEVLSLETKLSFDRASRTLHLQRAFTSKVIDLGTEYYPSLKAWYDHAAQTDRHELIFSRAKVSSAAAPSK